MIRNSVAEHARRDIAGKKVLPDVSVLLAAVLDRSSKSRVALSACERGSMVISSHVEDMARRVLAWNAPTLLGDFGAGLVELQTDVGFDRIESLSVAELPEWAGSLSAEDKQVLSDALAARVDFLFTHDHAFYGGVVPGLSVRSPSFQVWDPLAAENVQAHPVTWTFFGYFFPDWGSEELKHTEELFYVFEIANHIKAFYRPARGEYIVEWRTVSGTSGSMRMQSRVRAHYPHYVAVAADASRVLLFVDGKGKGKRVRLGACPPTSFHPFMSAASEYQIFGSVRFRMASRFHSEREIRRFWRANTLDLSDGELRLAEMASTFGRLLSRE